MSKKGKNGRYIESDPGSRIANRLNFYCSQIYPNYEVVERMNGLVDKLKLDHQSLEGSSETSDMYEYDGKKTCTEADIYMAVWEHESKIREASSKKTRSFDQSMLDVILLKWIQNKVVYSFDKDVASSLVDMKWDDLKLNPVDVLERLPIDCFALSFNRIIQLRSIDNHDDYDNYDGCLVMNDVRYILNPDNSLSRFRSSGLCIIFIDSTSLKMLPIVISNIEPTPGFEMTFENMYEANAAIGFKGDESGSFKKIFHYVFSHILYLCSQNAEISQTEENKKIYRPYTLQPKHKYREVKQFICGESTGIRIRDFKKRQSVRHKGGVGSVKAPHVRRAHYHRYWKGSGSDKHIEIRWMPPIYIHKDMKNYIKPVNARLKEEISK